jgi:hypothetical protein
MGLVKMSKDMKKIARMEKKAIRSLRKDMKKLKKY